IVGLDDDGLAVTAAAKLGKGENAADTEDRHTRQESTDPHIATAQEATGSSRRRRRAGHWSWRLLIGMRFVPVLIEPRLGLRVIVAGKCGSARRCQPRGKHLVKIILRRVRLLLSML